MTEPMQQKNPKAAEPLAGALLPPDGAGMRPSDRGAR